MRLESRSLLLTFWGLVVVITLTAVASGLGHAQQRERLAVNDARPVASAIKTLETRFNQVITYEDLPLVHADDILDVTESVRRDLHKYPPGKAPRVFVPRGGEINLEVNQNDPVEVVLTQLLSDSERLTPSATFRVEQSGGVIHIIPTSVKGPTGEAIQVRSVLDAPVELPAQERDAIQLLQAWCDAVSTSSQKQIKLAWAPLNWIAKYQDSQGLSAPNARDALTEILMRLGRGKKLSWQLLYSIGEQSYYLNVYLVKERRDQAK